MNWSFVVELKLPADAYLWDVLLRAVCLLALALAVRAADLVLLYTVMVHLEVRVYDASAMHTRHKLLRGVRRKALVVVRVLCHVLIILESLVIIDLLRRDVGLVLLLDRRLHVLRHERLALLVAIDDLTIGELVQIVVLH